MGKVLESWSQMLCTNFAEKPPSKLNFYCVPWWVPKVSINLGTLWEPISTANAVKLLVSIGGKNHWVCVGQAWALALRVKCPVISERTRDAVPLACYRQRVCHLVAPVFQFSCQQQGINRFECLKQSGDAQSGIAGCSLVLAEGFWFSFAASLFHNCMAVPCAGLLSEGPMSLNLASWFQGHGTALTHRLSRNISHLLLFPKQKQ